MEGIDLCSHIVRGNISVTLNYTHPLRRKPRRLLCFSDTGYIRPSTSSWNPNTRRWHWWARLYDKRTIHERNASNTQGKRLVDCVLHQICRRSVGTSRWPTLPIEAPFEPCYWPGDNILSSLKMKRKGTLLYNITIKFEAYMYKPNTTFRKLLINLVLIRIV